MVVVGVHVVENSQVIMLESSSVQVLRQEVEPNIIPVRWLQVIMWELFVLEGGWQWQTLQLGIKHSHFSLKVLILTSVVVGILVCHTESGSEQSRLWHEDRRTLLTLESKLH